MTEISDIEIAQKYLQSLHLRIMKMMDWDEDKTWVWIGTENPLLGYESPASMVMYGKIDNLTKFIDQAEKELNIFKERNGCDN